MQQHDGTDHVRTVGIADKQRFCRIEPVGGIRPFHEGCKGLRLAGNVLLVEGRRGDAAEEARITLIRAAATRAQQHRVRRQPCAKRQKARLVTARTVQQHDRRAIGGFRAVHPVDERQVSFGHSFFSWQGKLRKARPDIHRICAEMFRDEERGAQGLQGFVDRHAGTVGRIFDKRAAGFAHIERIEVGTVVHVDVARILRRQPNGNGLDGRPVRRAQRDMVDRSRAGRRGPETTGIADVEDITGIPGQPRDTVRLGDRTEAEMAADEGRRLRRLFRKDRCTADALDGIPGRDILRDMRRRAVHAGLTDQFDDDTVGILQPKHGLAELLRRAGHGDVLRQGARQPEADRFRPDRKGDLGGLAETDPARGAILPGQKGDQRAGARGRVAIEEVKLVGVFEAGRALDEFQAQEARVEIDVRLDFPGNTGDVMDAALHGAPPFRKYPIKILPTAPAGAR